MKSSSEDAEENDRLRSENDLLRRDLLYVRQDVIYVLERAVELCGSVANRVAAGEQLTALEAVHECMAAIERCSFEYRGVK